eukprot:gene14979-16522_t
MIYAFAVKQPQSEWCMQVDHDKFISIGKIVQFLGISTALLLPAFHAPTGSDTTSYFYRISKKSLFDRAAKQKSLPLLEKLGDEKSLNGDGERDITNFIHRAIYNGKENDGIVTTRINQYDKLMVKTTQSIIPDPGSLKYLIQKANLATYYLKFQFTSRQKSHAKKSGKKKDVCKSASFSLMDTSETSDATDSDDGLTGKTVFTEHGICPDDKGDYDWLYLRSEEDCAAYDMSVIRVGEGRGEIAWFFVDRYVMIRKASSSQTTCTNNSDDKSAENNGPDIEQPSSLVHCDYTIRSASSMLDKKAKPGHRQGRFALVNVWRTLGSRASINKKRRREGKERERRGLWNPGYVWRNISDDSPVQNDHLAVCDGRTVAAPDDFIPCDVIATNFKFEIYNLDLKRREFHEWYYYPNMVKEEVVVFMQYDSDPRSRARYTFHTAVKSQYAKANAPPRESIECRSIVFFPNHQPNTIPQNDAFKEEGDLVIVVISKIMESLKYPDMWPKDAQLWMKTELYVTGGVESVVKGIVADGAKEYRLDETTEEQRNEIIQRLLSNGKFQEIAKKYFPAV